MLSSSEPRPGSDNSDWADLFGGIPDPSSAVFQRLCLFCEVFPQSVNAALPWLAAEMGHNDGYATMLEFVRQWSGMKVYVPRGHERFVEKIGFPLGASTHHRLLGEASVPIEVPSAWGVFLALRRVAIAAAIRSNLPHHEISRRYGVTMRSLR